MQNAIFFPMMNIATLDDTRLRVLFPMEHFMYVGSTYIK